MRQSPITDIITLLLPALAIRVRSIYLNNDLADTCPRFESVLTNEFRTIKGACSSLVPQGPGYENVTLANQVCAVVGAVPGQSFVDGNKFVLLSYGFRYSHTWMVRKILYKKEQKTNYTAESGDRLWLLDRIPLGFADIYGTQYQHVPRTRYGSFQTRRQAPGTVEPHISRC